MKIVHIMISCFYIEGAGYQENLLSKAHKREDFNKVVFKLGIIVIGLYALFSLGTFFYGIHLVSYMNPNEIDVGAAYRYLSLETLAFMIGIIFSYVNVVFLVIDKSRYNDENTLKINEKVEKLDFLKTKKSSVYFL